MTTTNNRNDPDADDWRRDIVEEPASDDTGEPDAWTFGFIDGGGMPRRGLSFTFPASAEGNDAKPLYAHPPASDDALAKMTAERGRLQTILDSADRGSPIYKAVERVLDENSAWIARPDAKVTERIALAAGIAFDMATRNEAGIQFDRATTALAERDALREALVEAIAAWDALPGGQHKFDAVQTWLLVHMKPAIERARALATKEPSHD